MAVEDWTDERGTGSKKKQKEFFSVMAAVIDLLEAHNGQPDGKVLFGEGGGLCTVPLEVGGGTWIISYYVPADGRILLLTVFPGGDVRSVEHRVGEARTAMGTCIANGDDIDSV